MTHYSSEDLALWVDQAVFDFSQKLLQKVIEAVKEDVVPTGQSILPYYSKELQIAVMMTHTTASMKVMEYSQRVTLLLAAGQVVHDVGLDPNKFDAEELLRAAGKISNAKEEDKV